MKAETANDSARRIQTVTGSAAGARTRPVSVGSWISTSLEKPIDNTTTTMNAAVAPVTASLHHIYRPLNSGFRFSTKAAMPSF